MNAPPGSTPSLHTFEREADVLRTWLLRDAYWCWWTRGADQAHGGFHERLEVTGEPTGEPRRARLHPRQIYAFAMAPRLGWSGPAVDAVRHGVDYLLARYQRDDGLFRSLVSAAGAPLRNEAVLYDQAFVLTGLASAYELLRAANLRRTAHELLARLRANFRNPLGGFEETRDATSPLLANSHMHLLEAALAWIDMDNEPAWTQIAHEIVGLASSRFRDPASGFIREFFGREWAPADGLPGRVVEPGHQYEWAWLLLRWSIRTGDSQASSLAFDLIDRAEQHGVDQARGVAVNALLTDGVVRDAQARLWPQTERIKAACAAACFEREGYDRIAADAARSLRKYLATPLPGLWRDKMNPDGGFVEEPAPASSLYHIVGAVLALAQPARILEEGRSHAV